MATKTIFECVCVCVSPSINIMNTDVINSIINTDVINSIINTEAGVQCCPQVSKQRRTQNTKHRADHS